MKTEDILVSIGLPVYNGENFLSEAIQSILNQSYTNIELIVCDNASTDKTEDICRSFSKIDKRIRYFKKSANIGAAPNFNETFHLSKGKYFKWAAHDDICKPAFIEKCVRALENNPSAVLAYPKTIKINEFNNIIDYYEVKLPTDSNDASIRYDAITQIGYKCYEVFGLIRRSALMKTDLIGSFANGDGVLLAQLSLLGKFILVPDFLFLSRKHSHQSEAIYWHKLRSHKAWAEWFNPNNKNRYIMPLLKIYFEFFISIKLASKKYKKKCIKIFLTKLFQHRIPLTKEFLFPFTSYLRKLAHK